MSQKTGEFGEPWRFYPGGYTQDSENRNVVLSTPGMVRAVNCVNALVGIMSPLLFVKAVEELEEAITTGDTDKFGEALAKLRAAREGKP